MKAIGLAVGLDVVLGLAVVGIMDASAGLFVGVPGFDDTGFDVTGLDDTGLDDTGLDDTVAVGSGVEAKLMSNTGMFVASPILYALRVLPW